MYTLKHNPKILQLKIFSMAETEFSRKRFQTSVEMEDQTMDGFKR